MDDVRCGRGEGEGTPKAIGARYASLDAWRGLACLMVVVHHAGYALSWAEARGDWTRWLATWSTRRMSVGVSLFFVISGYCIAASADSASRKGGSPWSFLARRAWRIYPPYWAALFGFAGLVVLLDAMGLDRLYNRGVLAIPLDPPHVLDWRQWFGNLTLTETWRPHVWGPGRNIYTAVAWSLCFEEQFYFVCFLGLWLRPGKVFGFLGAATLVICGVRTYAWWVGGLAPFSGTFPLLWHEFAVGLAVYYRLNVARGAIARRLMEALLAGLLLVGWWVGGRNTITAAWFGLFLIALRPFDGAIDGFAGLAPLRACGRRCYSIYLAHLPAGIVGNQLLYEMGVTSFWGRALVMVPLVSAAGVAAGWAFHAFVEEKFLTPPRFEGIRLPKPRRRRVFPGARGRVAT